VRVVGKPEVIQLDEKSQTRGFVIPVRTSGKRDGCAFLVKLTASPVSDDARFGRNRSAGLYTFR
jgi:hypothetical protein